MVRREYAGSAPETTLASAIGATSTSIQLADGAGYPTGSVGPFFICIEPGTANEEKVLVQSRTDAVLTVASSADRGADSTVGVAHDAGVKVIHVWTATDANEVNLHANSTTGVHGVTGALVGTTQAATLTNKTMSGSSNTFSLIPQAAVTGLTTIQSELNTAKTNITAIQGVNTTQDGRLTSLEGINAGARLTTVEGKVTTLEGFDAGTRLTALESLTARSAWQDVTKGLAVGGWGKVRTEGPDLIRLAFNLDKGGFFTHGFQAFTLPSGYRPLSVSRFFVIECNNGSTSSGTQSCRLSVLTDGACYTQNVPASTEFIRGELVFTKTAFS